MIDCLERVVILMLIGIVVLTVTALMSSNHTSPKL